MKLFRTTPPVKIEIPVAPMFNIVFLLLIISMLNMKIVVPQENYSLNLPVSGPSRHRAGVTASEIKVSPRSDLDGNLTHLTFQGHDLGNDDAAFDRLNTEILALIG